MRKPLWLPIALLGLVALVTSPTGARAADRGARCYTVWVAAENGGADRAPFRGWFTFRASEILDLRFLVLLPARRGIEDVEVKLFTPKGHLYQALRIPVGKSPSPRPRAFFRWATELLPVAGTTIVTSSLYGRWKAEAYLDGATTPCGRARHFTLQP